MVMQVWWGENGTVAFKEEEEEEEEEDPSRSRCRTPFVHRTARATARNSGNQMPKGRIQYQAVLQMLSLHIPVLSSTSRRSLVHHARIKQSPFPISLFSPPSPSLFLFVSLSTTEGLGR